MKHATVNWADTQYSLRAVYIKKAEEYEYAARTSHTLEGAIELYRRAQHYRDFANKCR